MSPDAWQSVALIEDSMQYLQVIHRYNYFPHANICIKKSIPCTHYSSFPALRLFQNLWQKQTSSEEHQDPLSGNAFRKMFSIQWSVCVYTHIHSTQETILPEYEN